MEAFHLRGEKDMFPLLRLAAVLHVMELGLSCLLLSLGWMKEANPVAALVYQQAGIAGLIGLKMTALIAAVAIISHAIERGSTLAGPATAITFASGALAVCMLMLVIDGWLSVAPV